ncbi:MAG: hypothetical protein A2V78_13045 [Betaproteobacteria bacterium RBG_16_64_18]|nr:MAG: hypothetical protein A2V78_13045 [Betaproteobacteria bacterium RBG_16_64_18]OGA11026.1 MAG: hypothetical protein A3H33_03920 [Betaproteobacteria bacterium RIFCSPLOWO2_02_FULL_65_20]OGA38632.1 MAG: hypothetical protein A3G26_08895 [Betaproteobacteria bacterium RIFCSPLOWO2_12_FULL_65_110]
MSRVFLLLTALCLSATLQAQTWPVKPLRVIVNVAPGGVADLTMRVLGVRLSESLGQPVVVENRPGGDGYIGFEAVARGEAEGYTLLYAPGSTTMIAPHLVRRPDLDPLKVFAPIVPTGRVSLYLVVHPKLAAANFAEFLAHARANPGKLNYGTPGNGTSPHIATEVFNREANIKLNHIPYKGAGPALNDLLGGQIDLALDPGVGLQHVKSGKLRMLAVAGARRHPDYPNVPTLEESGIKGVDGGPYFGLYALAGTPRAILERLNAEVQKAMKEPVVRDRFVTLAVDIADPMTPDAFAAYIHDQSNRYAKLIPELGIGGR